MTWVGGTVHQPASPAIIGQRVEEDAGELHLWTKEAGLPEQTATSNAKARPVSTFSSGTPPPSSSPPPT